MLRSLKALGVGGRSASVFDGRLSEPERRAGDLARHLVREYEEQSNGWFWATDRDGRMIYLSAKVAREAVRPGIDVINQPLTGLFVADDVSSDTERTLAFHLTSRLSFSGYTVRAPQATSDRWFSISGRPMMDDNGNFLGFVGNGSDLTEKRRAEAEITRLALFDSLTGLANRQRMRLSLDQMLAQTTVSYRSAALLLLDLDRFKAVNDTLGHQVGDDLLKQVAQRLTRAVGDAGLVGRLGGDEFQVIVPTESNRDRLSELARSIITSLSHSYSIEGSSISIGCSIGIAIAPDDGGDSETLVRNADLALYAAKADGRGVHRFYREEMLAGAQNRKQLEDDLRHALAGNQLHVAYQPVVSTAEEKVIGYEALVRWTHPVRGAISPADFIPIAEDCGLIGPIGEWVLRTAISDAAKWPHRARVAVNVSPIQFANPALPSIVTNALANANLSPDRLELEITEGVFLNEDATSEQMFAKLKGIGVRLALDDFGTGYSSLGYLRKAPFDKIKIDQSFVRGAAIAGNRNAAIIKAIVTLANTLGMETTAEGVETQDEIALIRELGCSHIQGYVYGRAFTMDEMMAAAEQGMATAQPVGHRTSRPTRMKTLRWAALEIDGERGEVRIRNMSTTGAMIDGIEFDGDVNGMAVTIEIGEMGMVPAVLRWARDGQAGVEFAKPIALDRIGVSPNADRGRVRRTA